MWSYITIVMSNLKSKLWINKSKANNGENEHTHTKNVYMETNSPDENET